MRSLLNSKSFPILQVIFQNLGLVQEIEMIRERLSNVLVKMQLKIEHNIVAEQNIHLCHHPQHDEKNIIFTKLLQTLLYFSLEKN